MSVSGASKSKKRARRYLGRATVGVATLVLSLSLGGCSTSIADLPFDGPSDAPGHEHDVSAYPAVHDLPEPREETAMDPAEQARIEKELIAARDHQAQASSNAAK